jgi:hypothetical protein
MAMPEKSMRKTSFNLIKLFFSGFILVFVVLGLGWSTHLILGRNGRVSLKRLG